jgi:hypothetical protein
VLACHVTGAKVNGTFSLEPAFDPDDLDPATTHRVAQVLLADAVERQESVSACRDSKRQ